MSLELEKLYDNPFDDQGLEDMPDNEFEDEVNNLIEWCEDLDYEKYTANWHEVATSNKAEPVKGIYQQNIIRISDAELGGFSFQPNPEIMALASEMGGTSFGMQGTHELTQQMIDQNIAQIQREQQMQMSGQRNPVEEQLKFAKYQEEAQIKSNLDYENRLRGHMYQFEEQQAMLNQKDVQSKVGSMA